jgi:hypothetical protein
MNTRSPLEFLRERHEGPKRWQQVQRDQRPIRAAAIGSRRRRAVAHDTMSAPKGDGKTAACSRMSE